MGQGFRLGSFRLSFSSKRHGKTSLEPEEPGMFAEHGYKVVLSCCLLLAESETRDVEGN